jgi:hypothetical protein
LLDDPVVVNWIVGALLSSKHVEKANEVMSRSSIPDTLKDKMRVDISSSLGIELGSGASASRSKDPNRAVLEALARGDADAAQSAYGKCYAIKPTGRVKELLSAIPTVDQSEIVVRKESSVKTAKRTRKAQDYTAGSQGGASDEQLLLRDEDDSVDSGKDRKSVPSHIKSRRQRRG